MPSPELAVRPEPVLGRHRLQAYEGAAFPATRNFFTVAWTVRLRRSSYFALIETQAHHIIRLKRVHEKRTKTRCA